MRRRTLYVLMFSVPALLAAVMVSLALFGSAAGFLWLFVLGDEPWPQSASTLLASLFVLSFLALWVALLSLAYFAGRKQEALPALSVRHVTMSVGATVLLVLLALSHQWSVGNIGAPGNGALCSGYCREQGFDASSMPPRDSGLDTCSCLDAQGREATTLPMATVRARRQR